MVLKAMVLKANVSNVLKANISNSQGPWMGSTDVKPFQGSNRHRNQRSRRSHIDKFAGADQSSTVEGSSTVTIEQIVVIL